LEGTNILLINGIEKKIEELKVDDELIVYEIKNMKNTQNIEILKIQKEDTLSGEFKTSLIKNIWLDHTDNYYIINDKLNITGEHIILLQRGGVYFWGEVNQILEGDFMFTNSGIFERVIKIERLESMENVYNVQLNEIYNYFANGYLVHNGDPCTACSGCGAEEEEEEEEGSGSGS